MLYFVGSTAGSAGTPSIAVQPTLVPFHVPTTRSPQLFSFAQSASTYPATQIPLLETATPMSDQNIDSRARKALDDGEGILRLAPTWVPRSFLMPGGRLKLARQDLYALGTHRGGIDERWFASTTPAANEGAPPDEGLSYVVSDGVKVGVMQQAIDGGRAAEKVREVQEALSKMELIQVDRRMGMSPEAPIHCRLYVPKDYARIAYMWHNMLFPSNSSKDPDFISVYVPDWPETLIFLDVNQGYTYILGTDYPAMLHASGVALPELAHTIVLRGDVEPGEQSWASFLAEAGDRTLLADVRPDDISHVQFTSGTTGSPKGAMLRHGALCRTTRDWVANVGLVAGDRYCIVSPFFHISAVSAAACSSVLPDFLASEASIHGWKSDGNRSGKCSSKLVRSPFGSIIKAGTRLSAASSSRSTHRPVLPEPVMPTTTQWVVRSSES